MVKGDLGILPRVVLLKALKFIVDDGGWQSFSFFIHAFVKLAPKDLHSHDGEDEPKDQTHQQDVEDGGNGVHQCIHHNLSRSKVNSHIAAKSNLSTSFITFIPCHLEMALSGLKALKVLNDRKAVRLALPSMAKLKMDTCDRRRRRKADFIAIIVDKSGTETHADNDKVQAGPHAGKVAPQAKGHPLQQHLNGEENSKDQVDNLEDKHELLVVLEIDVLETEGQAGGKDEQEDGPLEKGVVHNVMDHFSHLVPPSHDEGVIQASAKGEPVKQGQ